MEKPKVNRKLVVIWEFILHFSISMLLRVRFPLSTNDSTKNKKNFKYLNPITKDLLSVYFLCHISYVKKFIKADYFFYHRHISDIYYVISFTDSVINIKGTKQKQTCWTWKSVKKAWKSKTRSLWSGPGLKGSTFSYGLWAWFYQIFEKRVWDLSKRDRVKLVSLIRFIYSRLEIYRDRRRRDFSFCSFLSRSLL